MRIAGRLLVLVAGLFAVAEGSMGSPREDRPVRAATLLDRHDPPVVIAHRGASAYAPENTLAAYRRALELGVAAVEADVQTTRDGVPVLLHDDTVDRTTSGRGPIAALDAAAVAELDAGAWFGGGFVGERVPTLDDLLALTGDRSVVCVELKGGEGLEEAVVRSVRRAGLRRRVVFFSFSAERLQEVRRRMPAVPRLYLANRSGLAYPVAELDVAKEVADAIGFSRRFVDAPTIAAAHARGLSVFVYTVNSASDARRLRRMGVDGLISDAPDVVQAAL